MDADNDKLLSHFASVFPVDSVPDTIAWYKENLGFKIDFTWEDPATYAVISRDEIKIHFTKKEDNFEASKAHTALYIFVFDVDKVFEEFKAKGLVTGDLLNADYGMRDFDITDLNGFRLTFGQSLEK